MTDEPKSDVPAGTPEGHAVLSDDDHGHGEAALGPIDWPAWAYALVGGAAGLIVLLVFWIAVGGPG